MCFTNKDISNEEIQTLKGKVVFGRSPHQSVQRQEYRPMAWKSRGGNASFCNSGFDGSGE